MNRKTFKKAGECFRAWKISSISASVLSLLLFFGQTASTLGNPTGGTVVAGSATIGSAGLTLTINQSSHNAIINWQQFSIANGETTKFIVPNSSSATLNRVTGGNPSLIYGSLQSNGILYLVNPSGIVVGPNGRIDTASFLASTLDVSNQQFLAGGDLSFAGGSNASIDNEGTIHASSGDVYLIANQVNNNGTITAPQGNVGMAAGLDVLFQQAGNQHLFIEATPAGTTRATGVTNTGTIRAAAAELKAAGGNAYALAINNTGVIAATGYKKVNGQVYLTSDGGNITNSGQISAKNANGNGGTIVLNGHGTSSSGTVLNSGKLLAVGTGAGTTGGTVEVLGNRVGIMDQGVVDVSGDAGGGTALIGGDEHGANTAIPDADQTYLGPDATIKADALTLGMGGKVILWGNQTTQVYGQISVKGGAQGGNGGFVETSAANLDVQTAPNLSAPHGTGGTWLLDPAEVNIVDNQSSTSAFSSPFTQTTGTYTLNQADLLTALGTGSVTITASTSGGGTGTISWTQPGSQAFDISNIPAGDVLTLNAPVQIQLNGIVISHSVDATGNLSLVLNSSLSGAGNVEILNSTLSFNGGSFTANGNGYVSSSDANGDANGVNIQASTINAEGGSINITGNAGYDTPSASQVAGSGILMNSTSNSNASTLDTSGAGNITLLGTFNQNVTVGGATGIEAVSISGPGNTISVATGTISITGTISNGTAVGNGSDNSASVEGIELGGGALVEATAAGGSITMTGNSSGATSLVFGSHLTFDLGIEIGGNSGSPTVVSVVGPNEGVGGTLTLNGTGGAIDTSNSTLTDSTSTVPFTVGVEIDNGTQLNTGSNATMMITGTGGAITTTGAFTGGSQGVDLDVGTQVSMASGGTLTVLGHGGAVNAGNGANASDAETDGVDIHSSVSVATGGSIGITGYGGSLDTSNATAVTGDIVPHSIGVNLHEGANVQALGTTTTTLMGTGGSVNAGSNQDGGSVGVNIGDDYSANVVSSGSGTIQITGNSTTGTAPSLGIGVLIIGTNIDGSDVGSATVESTTGNISITGTGAAGYTGAGVVAGNYSPNNGIAIVDNVTLTTGGSGRISLTGTGGANSFGVAVVELTNDTTLDTVPVLPVITAGGAFTATALSGTGIYLNASIGAASVALGTETTPGDPTTITSGPVVIDNSTVTLTGGDFTAYGAGATSNTTSLDGTDVLSSTINAGTGNISLTGTAGFDVSSSLAGIGIFLSSAVLDTTSGSISVTGLGGIGASNVTTNSYLEGVELDGGSLTASAGSIYIKGTVSSGTADLKEAGVVIEKGAQITASGTGGTAGPTAQGDVTIFGDTTGSTTQSLNAGVFIEGTTTVVSATGLVADSHGDTGLTITGISSAINGTTGASIDQNTIYLNPFTSGIAIANGATIDSVNASPITLNGTGGANDNTDPTAVSFDVGIFSPQSEETTTISGGTGPVSITGSGSTPGLGVVIGGPTDPGNASITSDGLISILDTRGDIILGPHGSITDLGNGNVILAAGSDLANSHYIINNSLAGAGAVQVNGGNFYLYSSDPQGDTFGGITVLPANMIFKATYATTGLPAVNEELFYAGSGAVGPNSLDGSGSNVVPPALIPQTNPPNDQGNSNPPPPPNFQGDGTTGQTGQQNGGLANSSSNGGQVGPGDAAQLNNGGLNNVNNPDASGFLGQALSPLVFQGLQDALSNWGDWNPADIPEDTTGGNGETILNSGDVVEIGDKGVKNIPLSQAPKQLQNALGGSVLNGIPSGGGH